MPLIFPLLYGGLRVTEEDLEKVAKRASELVLSAIREEPDIVFGHIYQTIGKNVVRKGLWALGLLALGVLAWLGASSGFKDLIK